MLAEPKALFYNSAYQSRAPPPPIKKIQSHPNKSLHWSSTPIYSKIWRFSQIWQFWSIFDQLKDRVAFLLPLYIHISCLFKTVPYCYRKADSVLSCPPPPLWSERKPKMDQTELPASTPTLNLNPYLHLCSTPNQKISNDPNPMLNLTLAPTFTWVPLLFKNSKLVDIITNLYLVLGMSY